MVSSSSASHSPLIVAVLFVIAGLPFRACGLDSVGIGDRKVTITFRDSNLCLAGSSGELHQVFCIRCDDAGSVSLSLKFTRQWELHQLATPHVYQFKHIQLGTCMTARTDNTVILLPCEGRLAQRWTMIDTPVPDQPGGVVMIQSTGTNLCISPKGADSDPVVLTVCNPPKWAVTFNENLS